MKNSEASKGGNGFTGAWLAPELHPALPHGHCLKPDSPAWEWSLQDTVKMSTETLLPSHCSLREENTALMANKLHLCLTC